MTTMQLAQPSQEIQLVPDLAALLGVAWMSGLKPERQWKVAPIYKEPRSVASSISIGQGASFLVTRKKVMPVQRHQSTPESVGGITVEAKPSWKSRGGYQIVYKVARVQFDDQGNPVPSQKTDYASILLDLMVLTHTPVMRHENIVSLLDLAWGHNEFLDTCEIPVAILEHADLGNLAHYQAKGIIGPGQKFHILHDVAVAISFLHDCSITHGDVKSENILLFSHPQKGILVKISDFGCSILGNEGVFNFVPRGTDKWASPEVREGTVQAQDVRLSDVYSYGLLAWRVTVDGHDPLSPYFLLAKPLSKLPGKNDLSRLNPEQLIPLFKQDYLGDHALPSNWFQQHTRLSMANSVGSCGESPILPATSTALKSNETVRNVIEIIVKSTLLYEPRARNLVDTITALKEAGRLPEYDPALQYRMIRGLTNISKADPVPDSITRAYKYDVLMENGTTISWNTLRHYGPSISHQIMKQKCRKYSANSGRVSGDLNNFAYGLACCFVSGMGSDRYLDPRKAMDYLLNAARQGSTGAQAAIPHFCQAYNFQFSGMLSALEKCAQWGSLAALEELEATNTQALNNAKTFLRNNMCGVGAQLFRYWKPPWLMMHARSVSFIDDFLTKTAEPSAKVEVTPRGDGLLHAAASLGELRILVRLVEHYGISVDLQNGQGESALHCALRSGHTDTANWLLDCGAEVATKSTFNHETPLHWLISIDDEELPAMAGRLLATEAAKVSLSVWAESCKYAATLVSGYNDRWDKLTRGTPLHWAICRKRLSLVKILLEHGADPVKTGDRVGEALEHTAVELAAFLHQSEILEAMIIAKFPLPRWEYFDLGSRNNLFAKSKERPGGSTPCGLSFWIKEAINGCDCWKMAFRHGAKWRTEMETTFKVLGKELSFAHLNAGVDGNGRSPLLYAAEGGYHEATSMIIDHLDGQTEVNAAWGTEEWTPIFYAVQRDNKRMFYSLLKHGADIYHRINSPNRNDWKNWTLLHVAARNIIDNDLELCVQLLDEGLCPDGIDDPIYGGPPQTPLSIAIEENQFALANLLREKGANIDAPCGYIGLQRTKLNFECSILGCVVASNMRFSGPRLKYLLWPTSSTIAYDQPDFIVIPRFGFTALHIAVLGEKILYEPEERDPDVASDILRLLLEKFEHAEELNAQTGGDLMTVLHLAVQFQNLDAVKQLLDMEEIDISLKNIEDQSPLEIAKQELYNMSRDDASSDKQTEMAQHIIDLLTNYVG